MTFIFIINPLAGRGNGVPLLRQRVQAAFAHAPEQCELYITQAAGDATDYVVRRCQAAREDEQLCFLACGGDGTLNEVARGAVGYPFACVGVVPCGTGNDFVKNFPQLDFWNLVAQQQGVGRMVDLLLCNGRPVVNICNAGLDANVARDITTIKRWPLCSGPMAYIVSLCKNFFGRLGQFGTVTSQGETVLKGELLLLVVANGSYYGGSFCGAPEASVEDGLMDVSIVPKVSRCKIISVLPRYQKGRHTSDPDLKKLITYRQLTQLSVQYDRPVTLCIDGETLIDDHIEASVLPNALRLWLPACTADVAAVSNEPAYAGVER